jgi:hypothetical protein
MIYGCTLLKRAQKRATLKAYPTKINPDDVAKPHECPPGVSSERADTLAPSNPKECVCPGCNKSRWKHDYTHTRIVGECRYPYSQVEIPTCQACIEHVQDKSKHEYEADGITPIERCYNKHKIARNWGDTVRTPEVAPSERESKARSGAHPREPSTRASRKDETTDMRGSPASGQPLGNEL